MAECSLKRYRYVGKERDNESGFYYIGARYYCPWLARWLEVDPINDEWYNLCKGNRARNAERQFVELTASSYEYCYANPVRFTDPTGEQVTPEQNAPRSWTDESGNKYSMGADGSASLDGGVIKGAKATSSESGLVENAMRQSQPTKDVLSSDAIESRALLQYSVIGLPRDPGVIRQYVEPNLAQKTKHWLSQQSILSPFAWVTGRSAPPPSAAQDLARPLSYFTPGLGFVKAVTESGLGFASGKPTAGDALTLGLLAIPYVRSYAQSQITTSEGYLFGSLTIKSPLDINVQRFGNMSLNKVDFWALKATGENQFVNRTFMAIKPEWNSLTQYTSGTIAKGTSIRIGFVGPQALRHPGGFLQIQVNSRAVLNQSTKTILR